jgi:ATP-dependent NAD(P)H-hydrate dehydratase
MLRNKSHNELVSLSRQIVQPLLSSFHKGQAGRIAVVGGLEDYTGAPFFAAHSAALIGCDLLHIICEVNAAPVLKLYLPDLMVHPYLLESSRVDQPHQQVIDDRVLPKVRAILNRMHLVVAGPGFGRDELMLKSLRRIIEEVKVLNIPLILDADALYLVAQDPLVVRGYTKAILTPNVVEFARIAKALDISGDDATLEDSVALTQRVLRALGGVTVVRKGEHEVIAKNDAHVVSSLGGLKRRVGGQGDTLTGAMGAFVIWAANYQGRVWDNVPQLLPDELTLLACFAGSLVVRLASARAFDKYGRAMQTLNVHEFLGPAFAELYPHL